MTQLLYPDCKKELLNRIMAEPPDLAGYQFFLKGDISGIQDFIFSVKSEKAAQSLKGRSFFVQALSEIAVDVVVEKVGADNTWLFFNGGGNFYLLLKNTTEAELKGLQAGFDQSCAHHEFHVSLSWFDLSGIQNPQFDAIWSELQTRSAKSKLRKQQSDWQLFFPFESENGRTNTAMDYAQLTRELRKTGGKQYGIQPSSVPDAVNTVIHFFGREMSPAGTGHKMTDFVSGLPVWSGNLLKQFTGIIERRKQEDDDEFTKPYTNNIIEFSYLADFAGERTGTTKLGILKMDVDGLGNLFKTFESPEATYQTSQAFGWFFGAFMNDHLLQSGFKPESDPGAVEVKFADNIYVVFSGGDDCFFVGAWDAVFEFAGRFHAEFEAFAKDIQSKIPAIQNTPTISAALLVVDPAFPVVRFAEMAEDALSSAKSVKGPDGKPEKNKIHVFGQMLEWPEFEYARSLAHRTADLILHKDESRSIIERIKSVARQYEDLQDQAAGGKARGPKVWRLFYTMRHLKEKNLPVLDKDIQQFSVSLLEAFQQGKKVRYPKFPVAARWAEFLSR